MRADLRRERMRRGFRPARVSVLFVGEAPPASGRFFYAADSGLYRAMRAVFLKARRDWMEEDFLSRFQQAGCYLVDLCGKPVDRLPEGRRRAARAKGEARIAAAIRRVRPEVVVTLTRSVAKHVRGSAFRAGWRGPVVELPYPGRWLRHRRIFEKELVRHLRGWFKSGILATRTGAVKGLKSRRRAWKIVPKK